MPIVKSLVMTRHETIWRQQIRIRHRLLYFRIILNTLWSCCRLTLQSSNKSFQSIWKIGFTAAFSPQGSMDRWRSGCRRICSQRSACHENFQDAKRSLWWYGSDQRSVDYFLSVKAHSCVQLSNTFQDNTKMIMHGLSLLDSSPSLSIPFLDRNFLSSNVPGCQHQQWECQPYSLPQHIHYFNLTNKVIQLPSVPAWSILYSMKSECHYM